MSALVSRNVALLSRQHIPAATGGMYMSKQHESTGVTVNSGTNLGTYTRGRGGRSSFNGIVATVIGASGFLGKYVVNKLGKVGSQVIVPYRADPYFVKDLKLAGDLGQVLFLPYHLMDEDSIRNSMKYSNVVINLVGRDWETKNFDFNKVHVQGAEKIARIAKEMGVEKFVHMSHISAQANPPEIYVKGGSQYLRSKHLSEQVVREAFPDAIIMKCADIYGPEDRFIRYYASAWRRAHGRLPMWRKGEETIKMPVFVSDVAAGIINAINDPEAVGKTFECVGPHSYQLSELVDFMYRVLRWKNMKRTYISPLFKMKVMFMSNAPSTPLLNIDKLDREHVSDKTTHLPTLEELGVKLTRFEDRAPFELKPFMKDSYYEEQVGEFEDAEPPKILV